MNQLTYEYILKDSIINVIDLYDNLEKSLIDYIKNIFFTNNQYVINSDYDIDSYYYKIKDIYDLENLIKICNNDNIYYIKSKIMDLYYFGKPYLLEIITKNMLKDINKIRFKNYYNIFMNNDQNNITSLYNQIYIINIIKKNEYQKLIHFILKKINKYFSHDIVKLIITYL